MPFPPYVPTRQVTLGGAQALETSDPLVIKATIKASRSLVWDATGYRFESARVDVAATEAGGELTMLVPRTDVVGWRDSRLNALIDISAPGAYTHAYTLDVQFFRGDMFVSTATIGPFTVPAGDGALDLDKVIPAGSTSGQAVSIPDSWSAAVSAAQQAADDAAQDAATAVAAVAGKQDVATLDEDVAQEFDAPDSALRGRVSAHIVEGVDELAVGSKIDLSPQPGRMVVSSKLRHLHAASHPRSRRYLWDGQEPSLLWVESLNKWIMTFTGGSGFSGTYIRTCPGDKDPTVQGNWTSQVRIVDLGVGRASPHSFTYIEGSTAYCYFVDDLDKTKLYVATSPVANMTDGAWTIQAEPVVPASPGNLSPAGQRLGNPSLIKIGATYYMILECQNGDNLGDPNDGNPLTYSWQVYLMKATSPTGTFTKVYGPITSLRLDGTGSVSGLDPHLEDGKIVAFLHGNPWARYVPDDIYRAVIDPAAIETDAWSITNNGSYVLQRAHEFEVDQAVDPSVQTGPGGFSYMAYSANDNTAGTFRVMITRLLPTKVTWDQSAGDWIASEHRDSDPPRWNYVAPRKHQWAAYVDPDGEAKQGTWNLTSSPSGMYGNARLTNTTLAQNDYIDFDVILGPGTWQLRPVFLRGPDHGIVKVSMAFASKFFLTTIGQWDGYAASQTLNAATLLTPFTVRGRKTARARLRFQVTDKNASSSGYAASMLAWSLKRTDF